ncbi:MAG: 50S ribosomal protein L11 methyltransferase [Flavisolibacter sp.]
MASIVLNISAVEEQQEVLISQLSELGAEGFEQKENILLAYFNELEIKSYEVNEILSSYTFETSIIEERNWNEEWEKNFQPVRISDFCTIRAEFHKKIEPGKYDIIITPKMSFGTGHHATTYLMIQQMKDLNFSDKSVFDFGTGTGILAILAEKLGASSVIATDVDHWSRENALENIERNNCRNIEVKLSSEIPQGFYDIILANINRNVLLHYLPHFKNVITKNGLVLMSGILSSDISDLINFSLENGLQLRAQHEKDNWASLLFIA